MENNSIISIFTSEDKKEVIKGIKELIIKRVEDDLSDFTGYILDPEDIIEDIVNEIKDEVVREVKNKFKQKIIKKINKSLGLTDD